MEIWLAYLVAFAVGILLTLVAWVWWTSGTSRDIKKSASKQDVVEKVEKIRASRNATTEGLSGIFSAGNAASLIVGFVVLIIIITVAAQVLRGVQDTSYSFGSAFNESSTALDAIDSFAPMLGVLGTVAIAVVIIGWLLAHLPLRGVEKTKWHTKMKTSARKKQHSSTDY